MRKLSAVLMLLLVISVLGGCGASYPEYTEDENDLISAYSVSLLLKYDKDNHSRLVDTSLFLNEYNAALKLQEDSIANYQAQIEAEEEQRRNETQKQEESLQNAGNDADSGNNDKEVIDEYGGATVIDNNRPTVTLEQFIGADSFSIEYMDYSVEKQFSDSFNSTSTPIYADSGKAFLIVRFNVTNNGSDNNLDIFNQDISFKLNVNQKGAASTVKAALDNELSEYYGQFRSGESKVLFLIHEVPENYNITSISLNISSDVKGEYNISLY